MTCDEFEQALQRQADGVAAGNEALVREHARNCAGCRELEDGFRLVLQGFTVGRIPVPSDNLTDRIMAAIDVRSPTVRLRRAIGWLAAAATLLAAIGLWSWQSKRAGPDVPLASNDRPIAVDDLSNSTHDTIVTTNDLPAADEPLFPELADSHSADSRDSVVLVEAVEPVSEIFRAVGRSLGSPVRPIAASATEAFGNLIKDIPESDSMMMSVPGMREIMPQPMKKKMGEVGPSS